MMLKYHPLRVLPVLTLLAAFSLNAQAETFRCGSRVISTDTTAAEILELCGQPDSQTSVTEPVRVRTPAGGMVTNGETTKEQWVYARGNQAQPMVVTIIDGKVKSIERQR
jgi:hypothetical protein